MLVRVILYTYIYTYIYLCVIDIIEWLKHVMSIEILLY